MPTETLIEIVDNVFVRMFELRRRGDVHAGHAHTFDHITLLAKGEVVMRTHVAVETTPTAIRYSAPCLIVTPKGVVHAFEAMRDDCLLCCIHAIRDGDGLDDIAPQEITREQAGDLMARYPLIQVEGTRNG